MTTNSNVKRESSKVRVFLVDAHQLVLEGLRRILEGDRDIEVIGEARNADEAIEKCCVLLPDMVLMDLEMPGADGIEAISELRQRLPDVDVLVFSLGSKMVKEAIGAGASGYLTKDCETEEIIIALRQIRKGLCPLAPSVTRGLVTELATIGRAGPGLVLTERETNVLKLIAEGRNSTEISGELFVSLSTVKREVGGIFDKLGVDDRPHAVAEGIKRGLI